MKPRVETTDPSRSGRPERPESEHGFTLIELMMVVLIIGILIAIALPTFIGTRQRASDRATQEDLRTGLITAMTYYTEGSTYSGFDVTEAEAAEPTLEWISPGAPTGMQVSIAVATANDLVLVKLSRSGTYFCLAQQFGNPLTTRGKGATFAAVDTLPECTGGW